MERRQDEAVLIALHALQDNIEAMRVDLHKHLSAETVTLQNAEDIQEKMLMLMEIKPTLDELVILWRGSKILGVVFIGISSVVAIFAGSYLWIKDHLK